MPDKKDKGTITKLVIVAMLSNLSAHSPAQIPAAPKINEHKITYTIRRNGYSIFILINIEKIIIDRKVIIIALVIDAEIIDKVTSAEDKGAPIKSTILPITLPIKIDDEEWANDWDINCIAINPGAKKFINTTPNTSDLLSPIAKFITVKNKIAVVIGPTIVWPATDKNLKFSFKTNDLIPIQLMLNLLTPILYLLLI